MITFEEGTITKEQLVDMTKGFLGIRYRTYNDGSFEAYANAWTMIVDIFRYIRKKITK
jgi:hypothetical protein